MFFDPCRPVNAARAQLPASRAGGLPENGLTLEDGLARASGVSALLDESALRGARA
jgi:hypothetical protein